MADFFDIRTLSMVAGLTSISAAVIMVYFSMRRLTYPGFTSWTAGFIISGLGMILLSLRQQTPAWASILIANYCIFMFPVLLLHGLGAFKKVIYNKWLSGIIMGAGMIILAYYTYWDPCVKARIVVVSLEVSALLILNVVALFQRSGLAQDYSNNLLNTVFAFMAIWYLIRAALTPFLDADIEAFFSGSALQGFSFIVYTIGSVFIMSGLIALNAQRLESDLASADQSIKKLKELVPICSSCKKIRDDQGYWQAVESYIERKTQDDLTHSICPECAKRLYPDIKIYCDEED